MAAEAGHAPNRVYTDRNGNMHLNGASFFDNAENDIADTLNDLSALGTGQPASVTFTPAAGASNVCEVTIQVKDGAGVAIAAPTTLVVTLSDAATGAGLTGTTASGAVAAKAASGADLDTLVSKKALLVQTLATGVYVLSITDSAKTGFYVTAQIPGKKLSVSAVLVTGDYG